jgi:hypothetical protein
MTNTYAARSHSAWFGRTLDALQRRQPAIAELLPALTAQTLDAQVIDRCWATVESLSRPKGSPDTPEGRAAIDPGPALRRMRQLLVMAIIERDVTQQAPLSEVCGAISAWGIRAVEVAMRYAAAELAGVHGRPLDSEGAPQDLLVIGMGKIGGNELNVSSDIDLVFAHRDGGQTENGRLSSGEFFHRAARKLCGTLSDVTEDGFVFRVDTRLRPNGDAGPLVVNLPMLENYFYDQGREWERFAWVKALVIADSGLAGDAARRAGAAIRAGRCRGGRRGQFRRGDVPRRQGPRAARRRRCVANRRSGHAPAPQGQPPNQRRRKHGSPPQPFRGPCARNQPNGDNGPGAGTSGGGCSTGHRSTVRRTQHGHPSPDPAGDRSHRHGKPGSCKPSSGKPGGCKPNSGQTSFYYTGSSHTGSVQTRRHRSGTQGQRGPGEPGTDQFGLACGGVKPHGLASLRSPASGLGQLATDGRQPGGPHHQ